MEVTFNPPVRVNQLDEEISSSNFVHRFKNADLDFVLKQSSEDIRQLLNSAPLEFKHKYICVDIKSIITVEGQCVCLPGWHLDTVENPFNSDEKYETHHILCLHSDDTTEYIKTELTLDIDPHDRIHTIRDKIDAVPYDVFKAPRNAYITYSRLNFHRGPWAARAGRRTLIRLSETDVIKPNRTLVKL
jgi:hypothetical protein